VTAKCPLAIETDTIIAIYLYSLRRFDTIKEIMDNNITQRGLFLVLSLLTGSLLLSNFIDYQHTLSTGDHGMVLYAAEANLRGERPFHDYHYFYGPFMPYYYSAFLKTFGNQIPSVLIGQQFLNLLGGVLIYSALSLFVSPLISFLGSVWFWVFNIDFFYTYNHQGVILCLLFAFFTCLHYLKHNQPKMLYVGLFGAFVAGLIKLNFGFSIILSLGLSIFLINTVEKRRHHYLFYTWCFILTPLCIMISNYLFVIGLPFSIIRQCYQYFGNDAVAAHYPKMINSVVYLIDLAYKSTVKSWYSELLLIVIAIIGLANVYQIKKRRHQKGNIKKTVLLLTIPFIFYVINIHEYLLSGIYFRSFYSFPFLIIFGFLCLGSFAAPAPRFVKTTLSILILAIALAQFKIMLRKMDAYRTPAFYLPMKKARIFVSNRSPWAQTVTQTTRFLQQHVKENELFFALPYEPLYYYLADKKSPVRELVLFDFLDITTQQEKDIIEQLERKNVNWIVISNRAITEEIGMGVFGVDYAPLLAKHIDDHFKLVEEFGIWTPRPSWAWFHGTRILKRENVLNKK